MIFKHALRAALLTLGLTALSSPTLAVEEGEPAPLFELPAVRDGGSPVSLQDLRGKLVYVDFWASWCLPCLRSLPEINTLYEQYRDQGFEVVAITIDDPVEDALDFLDDLETPLAYHVVADQRAEVMDLYDVVGMPTSFLIDQQGVIRKVHKGYRDGDAALLEDAIQNWIDGP